MGGGSSAAAAEVVEEANPEFTGQMRTFGAGMPSTVQSQLNTAGLGGILDQTQFNQTTMPVFKNPAEIELYLKSLGKTPASFDATSAVTPTTTEEGYSNG